MRTLERELETCFIDRYRRIWVTYTRLGTVQLVLFPIEPYRTYNIISQKNFGEITFEKLKDLIMRNP